VPLSWKAARRGRSGARLRRGRMSPVPLRRTMTRSADGSLRGRRTVRWPLLRLAGMRAQTLAALGNAAAESTPALLHAELEFGGFMNLRREHTKACGRRADVTMRSHPLY
jgi:hypothetical protein